MLCTVAAQHGALLSCGRGHFQSTSRAGADKAIETKVILGVGTCVVVVNEIMVDLLDRIFEIFID